MHSQTQIAIHAAKLQKTSGHFAARRYAERRGCPLRLYRLACLLTELEAHEAKAKNKFDKHF